MNGTGRGTQGSPGSGQEFQIETRHLAFLIFLVVALCVASFMLGRWVERQSVGPELSAMVSEGGAGNIEEMGDVSEELTFFDSLKNEQPVALDAAVLDDRAPMPAVASGSPAAPRPDASRRSIEEGVFIQVLATAQRSAASGLRRRLRDRGYTALMVSEAGAWKVRVGPYADREDAERAAQRLREQEGLTTWIP